MQSLVKIVEIRQSPAESVELIDKRSEFSRTMKNADGSFSRHQSSFPLHYIENNKWVPINTPN